MKRKKIKKDLLNQISSYLSHLKSLLVSINQLNEKTIIYSSIDDVFDKVHYELQESIMLKLFDFLPIKVRLGKLRKLSRKNKLLNISTIKENICNKIFYEPKDNIFLLKRNHLYNELKNLCNNEYLDIFFANYFLRNYSYHKRQNISFPGMVGGQKIEYITTQIIIDKGYKYLKGFIRNQSNVAIFDNKIKICKSDNNKLLLIYNMDIKHITQLISDIANAFKKGLYKIIDEIDLLHDNAVKKEFNGMAKTEVCGVISKWIQDIPNVKF